jgi:hypothetical protein
MLETRTDKVLDAHTHSCTFAGELMTDVFWNWKGMPMVEFMQQETAVMSEVYCRTLKCYVESFRTKGV